MSLSVIIPVYNAEAFLRECVQSVLQQPQVTEIILIEDGSPDDALSICKDFENQHEIVRLLRHPNGENRGAGASRNLGILNSTGDYIAFLDADDYYLDNRFKRDLEILESDKEVDGVYNILGATVVNSRNSQLLDVDSMLTFVKGDIKAEELFEKLSPVGGSGYFSIDTLTVRKSIFNKVGLFDISLPLSQDTHMFIKMAAKARLVSGELDYPVAIRRIHANNRSRDPEKLLKYKTQVFKSLFFWSLDQGLDERKILILWEKYFAYSFYHGLIKNAQLKKALFLYQSVVAWPRLALLRTFWNKFPLFSGLFNK